MWSARSPLEKTAVPELVIEHTLTIGGRDLKTLESFCRWCFHVMVSVLQTVSVHLCVFPASPTK